MEKEYKGYNGTVVVTDHGVLIKRGKRSFWLGGGYLRGDKSIPYQAISAIQLKKAGMSSGYIQFSLTGGSEAKGGLLQATTDENTVMFYKSGNTAFEECKRLIESRIASGGSALSPLDELAKLSDLLERKTISDDEFQRVKQRIFSDNGWG